MLKILGIWGGLGFVTKTFISVSHLQEIKEKGKKQKAISTSSNKHLITIRLMS